MHTLTITTAGQVKVDDWPGEDALLAHLYAEIGCQLVTPVDLGVYLTMWCDDEGLLADEACINEQATKLAGVFGQLSSYLVGTVVVTARSDAEGHTRPLSPGMVAALRRTLGTLKALPLRLPDSWGA